MELILASRSPRRRELLSRINLPFRTVSTEIDELSIMNDHADCPERVVTELALAKARAVLHAEDEIVIGSDTVVVRDNVILGKPADADEAQAMLRSLCGREHRVLTAVALLRQGRETHFLSEASVFFYPLDEAAQHFIRDYVISGSPMDKAGAYGIQDEGALLIEGIRGDYYTVMGLPLARLWRELRDFAPELFDENANEPDRR